MNRRRRLILCGSAAILLGGLATAAWLVATAQVPDLDDYRAGTLLTDRSGIPLRVRLGHLEQDSRPVHSEAISPWAKAAMVSAEDKRFARHAGLDPIALCRAIVQNVVNGRRISGASTLSTQVIRLTEPRPRTMTTKLLEAAAAMIRNVPSGGAVEYGGTAKAIKVDRLTPLEPYFAAEVAQAAALSLFLSAPFPVSRVRRSASCSVASEA